MLEVGANGDHGYIDAAMMEQSKLRLAGFGLQPGLVEFEVSATNGASATSPAMPLPRGIGLSLSVSYPVDGLLAIDQLIGLTPPPGRCPVKGSWNEDE